MRVAYFDCFAGASGDMVLGALIDAGASVQQLQDELAKLNLPGCQLKVQRIRKGGIAATDVQVVFDRGVSLQHLADIEELITASDLPSEVKERSLDIFRRLTAAEARVHGVPLSQVHFDELGELDTIVDVVGAILGLRALGVESIYVSRLPMGHGFVSSAHGRLPLPAPATLELLRGVPIFRLDVEGELVTPTGAAVLTTLAVDFGTHPPFTLESVGYGAGKRDFAFPNLLRLLIGSTVDPGQAAMENLTLLETNIDDMSPELYEHTMERLFEAGALDVYLMPIQMKKSRPGTLLSVLCLPEKAESLRTILLLETTTLGIRQQQVERYRLEREIISMETRFGAVRVKVAKFQGRILKASPEYEDCRRLAMEKGIPLREVYGEAEAEVRRYQEESAKEDVL